MKAPVTIIIVMAVFAVSVAERTYSDEQPSLISSLLDLLPEVEAISAKNPVQVDVPRIRKSQVKNIIEIFELFIPFMKEVLYNRAEQTGEEVSEETYETIETMERLFPKLINLVVALTTRPQFNPDDEPALPDYRSIAKGNRKFRSSEEGPGNFVELPQVDREVIGKVLNQTSKIFSQISRASTSRERSRETSNRDRNSSYRPFYIGAGSTTRRPSTPRRITYTTTPKTTPRQTYTTTTQSPRTYATTPAVPDDAVPSRYGESSTSVEDTSESYTPGAQVPFFNLPATRRRSYQRVARGSPKVDLSLTRHQTPRKYFYV